MATKLAGSAATTPSTLIAVWVALVAYYFMGLRYEGAAPRLVILLGVVLVGLILALTFLDLKYR